MSKLLTRSLIIGFLVGGLGLGLSLSVARNVAAQAAYPPGTFPLQIAASGNQITLTNVSGNPISVSSVGFALVAGVTATGAQTSVGSASLAGSQVTLSNLTLQPGEQVTITIEVAPNLPEPLVSVSVSGTDLTTSKPVAESEVLPISARRPVVPSNTGVGLGPSRVAPVALITSAQPQAAVSVPQASASAVSAARVAGASAAPPSIPPALPNTGVDPSQGQRSTASPWALAVAVLAITAIVGAGIRRERTGRFVR